MSTRYVQPLRTLVQTAFLVGMGWTCVSFYRFVEYYRSGSQLHRVPRPESIEAFLPVSGLLGLTAWLKGAGFTDIHPAAVVILVTVIAGSLLLRRSFCSWICPVATLSEWAWQRGFSLFRRNVRLPSVPDRVFRGIKYLLLAFFLYSIMWAMPPDGLEHFINSDYHKLADVRLLDFFLRISPPVLAAVLLLAAASVVLRNPFCRYLCPYGALLGLAAFLSPFRVTRSRERCVSCGVCSQVCPTYIDVMHCTSVSSPECIGCWRCISYCRVHTALSMRFIGRYAVPGLVFALLVVLFFRGGPLAGERAGHWRTSLTDTDYRRLLGK